MHFARCALLDTKPCIRQRCVRVHVPIGVHVCVCVFVCVCVYGVMQRASTRAIWTSTHVMMGCPGKRIDTPYTWASQTHRESCMIRH